MQVHVNKDADANSYNEAPYPSFPIKQSHPTQLFSLASLFGLKPPPIENARILELGCASGDNLIPVALSFPKSYCMGIDFSSTEINIGHECIKKLKIKNIELKKLSILDFPKNEKPFDYIICHGVYSWVDHETRKKILEICRQYLTKSGVAYVSYNTLPGWNMVNSIRDLMLWHTQNIDDPKQKIAQARGILKFIGDGLGDSNAVYPQFLKNEIKMLSQFADNYILHDHLSTYNEPIYFYEFMEEATKHELAYLSDAVVSSMYTGNLPPSFSNELNKIKNIIAANQYMDFIRNNRFRSTLLCHQAQQIDRKLKAQDVSQWYIQLNGIIDEAEFTEDLIHSDKDIQLRMGGVMLTANTPHKKAVLYVLYQNRYTFIHYSDLKKALEKYCSLDSDALDKFLQEEINLIRLLLAGLINFSYYPATHTTIVNEKPKACPLAQYHALRQNFATNHHHLVSKIDPLTKTMLEQLDGKHTHQQIIKNISELIQKGELSILDKDKKPIANQQIKNEVVEQLYFQVLQKMANSGLLIK